ncbi:MAG: hypothetical protein JNM40_01360 [Myxococcales bacterium]|nr:hypothetical protein [Myxococcales bacterium]
MSPHASHPTPTFTPRSLLSSHTATAQQTSEDQIEFVCEVGGLNGLFRFLGGLCLTGALVQWTAALFSPKASILLVCGSLLLVIATILLGLAKWQRSHHGRFVLDRKQGLLSQFHGARLVRQIPRSRIQQISAPIDFTDGMHPDKLPELPRWLLCHADGSPALRLGKGTLQELQPALRLLAAWQLPVSSDSLTR